MAQVNAGRVRFVSRGEYNSSTQYYTFDLVNYNGNSYYAKENTIGNLPTDTTKWQLVAEKGNDGPTGQTGATGNGVVGIEKTSTSGLVDTYTMTYTNGNSDTFEVTNGQDGEVTQAQLDEVQADLDRYKTIENALPHITGDGESITLDNTANSVLHLDLKGNTSQDSTTGKNLWFSDLKQGAQSFNNGTNVASDRYVCNSTKISVEAGQTYTISAKGYTPNISCGFVFYNNGTFVSGEGSTNTTITVPNGANQLVYNFYNSNGLSPSDLTEIQLEKNNTATSYEPYTGGSPAPSPSYPQDIHIVSGDNTIKISNSDSTQTQTQLVSLGSLWLGKISTYQDYFYKSSGKWYLYKELGKDELDGTESWDRNTTGNYYQFYKSVNYGLGGGDVFSAYSTHFKYGNTSAGNLFYVNSAKTLIVFIRPIYNGNDVETINDFKTMLGTLKPVVYYVLSTPTNTEITDTTLKGQLDNIEKLMSYNSQTNISQVNNDLPFIISASALKDISNL